MRRLMLIAIAVVALLVAGASFVAAPIVGARMNRIDSTAAIPVSPRADSLHATLRVADLHDDLLLWDRSVLSPGTRGHTDIARMAAGNIAVQVFSTVTKTPKGINYERNSAATDNVTLMAVASRWPMRTWNSRLQRALHQARKLERAAAASDGRLSIARTRMDLQHALDMRAGASGATATSAATAATAAIAATAAKPVIGILSTEGLHALDGRLEHLDTLFAHGFRMAGLTHFFDNEVAGSAHGEAKGGLTPLGRQVLMRMEALKMSVDLAHVSPAAFDEALAIATRPVVVSHTGVRATCPGPRNLSDDQLRRLAANGALIGIGFWEGAVCDPSPRDIAKAIRHAVDIAGLGHVALGSDWDGGTTVAFGADGVAQLTQALLDAGFAEAEIRAVMGENAIRFLLANLP